MKKIIVIGSALAVIGLLMALTIPALAHGSGNGTANSANGQAWEDMYNACQNGGWEAMQEAASGVHGDDFGNMPYHEEYNDTTNDGNETSGGDLSGTGGSYMGGGMMDGGWGGMMGGGMMGR